ncbi:MAG: hypothetical protein M0P26_06875 [Bacteroidales bacterium]|nr:hypothetical protein [Bacteroidales bacterium]MDD4394068.1 hypothetical protein [Desulfobacterales bacterium]
METGKDITSAFTKPKLTPGTIIAGAGSPDQKQETEQPPETKTDHPITQFLDFAVNLAVPLCQHNGLEPPAVDTYQSFTRNAVNEAAWEYMPCTEGGELPKWVVLIIAIVGMILVFAPTTISLLQKKTEAAELAAAEEQQDEDPEPPRNYPEPSPEIQPVEMQPANQTPETAIVGL